MIQSIHNYLQHLFFKSSDRWLPLLAVYYLTYSCRFRCPYCSDGNGVPYHKLTEQHPTGEKALEILRAIRRYSEYIVLTGGEPLDHPDLDWILNQMNPLGFQGITLTTNGLQLPEHWESISRSITDLVISLDTLDNVRADTWYGAGPGTLSGIIAAIEEAHSRRSKRYRTIISSVVTPANISDLYTVYEFARKHGIVFAASPQLLGVKAHDRLQEMVEYREFYDFLISEKKKGRRIFGSPLYLEYMRDLRFFKCQPFTMLTVSPTGQIYYPCLEQGRQIGAITGYKNLHQARCNGEKRFGPPPECDNRCHSPCALGFGLTFERPLSPLGEIIPRFKGIARLS